MILVFGGAQHSPYDPGVHTLIGTCDTVEEARQGVELWWEQQMQEWLAILAAKHERAYAQGIVDRATCWHQIAEFVPETGKFTVLEEVKPTWRPNGL